MLTLTEEQISLLHEPLPSEALKPHPTKSYLTTINAAYVIERLNNVFGIGAWYQETREVEQSGKFVVVHATLHVPNYAISIQTYGGNDNPDRGDAYKGAQTDALTKAASMLGIGLHVWKNEKTLPKKDTAQAYVSESSSMCSKCGSEMEFRQGTNAKTGKDWKAMMCVSGDRTHTVWQQ